MLKKEIVYHMILMKLLLELIKILWYIKVQISKWTIVYKFVSKEAVSTLYEIVHLVVELEK